MKKIFTLAIAAAALIGCTKTEANYTDAQQISFMPVSKFDTKAVVEGATYSENYPFYVYANAKSDGASTFNSKYFEKIEFIKDGNTKDSGKQVYKGNPSQYWPNVNPLVFAGFTKAGNVDEIAKENITTSNILDVITIPGYTQPRPTVEANNDLMYFFADNNGNGYDKKTTYVDPIMKHACSWITINIEVDRNLVTYWNDLQVLNVRFVNLHETGTVTFPKGEGRVASWNFDGKAVTQYVNIRTQAKAIAATNATKVEFADVLKNTIVLPQPLADAQGNAAVKLSVTYSYTTPAGVEGFTEEKVLYLFYDDAKSAWEPGKHYTYNLTLTAEEIKIAPSSTNWDSTTPDSNKTI